jgi:arylsulfatase A-like enzyme
LTNVLIYVVDALRADHLGCYGYTRPTSPNFDALAADPLAVRFTQAFSPSTWTKPVAASLLSGCYPPAHGVRTRNDLFIRNVPRLPELLQSAGYRTAAVSTIGNVSSALGFGIGFDRFVDLYKDPLLANRREVSNTGAWKLYFEEDVTVVLPLAEDVNAMALAWLDEPQVQPASSRAPWFLFLWVLDPHDPYFPPPGFDRWHDPSYAGKIDGSSESIRRVRTQADVQRLIDLYDGEIAYADDQFGRLVAQLKARGLYDDTLVVVAGDHGEAFGDHDDFVHGHLAYDEIMHVPFILKLPAKSFAMPAAAPAPQAQGRASSALAQLTDIAPTVLDVLGLGASASGMQGHSLLPAILDDEAPRTMAFAETQSSEVNNRLLAARDQRWKYLRVDPPVHGGNGQAAAQALGWRGRLAGYRQQLANPEMVKKVLANPMFYVRRQRTDREMLFDLQADPGEHANLVASQPAVAEHMRTALQSWLAGCHAFAGADANRPSGIGLDEATRKQLEGLGYL